MAAVQPEPWLRALINNNNNVEKMVRGLIMSANGRWD
jgi:hypothetical protein